MDGPVLEEEASKMLGLSFFSKLDWGSYIISVAKTASRKIGATIHSMKFISHKVRISINLPYCFAWNTIVMSRLLLCRTVGPSLAASLTTAKEKLFCHTLLIIKPIKPAL